MTTLVAIQARMSSSRFPGKMLAQCGGVPLVERVARRAAAAEGVDGVVVATSREPSDNPLAQGAAAAGFDVFRGDLDDVLGRMAAAAGDAETVVRVTGDCPLLDPALLTAMLEHFHATSVDYLSNVSPPSWPNGLDIEIMRGEVLRQAAELATRAHDREHVTPFIRSHPERYRLANYPNPGGDWSDHRWSVDRPSDLALVNDLIAAAGVDAGLQELMAALEADPDLASRSRQVKPNEGAVATFRPENRKAAPRRSTTVGDTWWQRARHVMPMGTSSHSGSDIHPNVLLRGDGCRVVDADGHRYIDLDMASGAVTVGHAHPEVTAAVTRQLASGAVLGTPQPLEVELAERLVHLIPCAEQVCFSHALGDALAACLNTARAVTGRQRVLSCDDLESPAGDDGTVSTFPYGELDAVEALLDAHPCAAVVLSPVGLAPPPEDYLQRVQQLTRHHGALLIFDESLSGFRWAPGGAQEHFGVLPDLCVMGTGLANGLPLALVAGHRDAMVGLAEANLAPPWHGEAVSLAAAMATLDVMERDGYWRHVWRQGRHIKEGFETAAARHGFANTVHCLGMPPSMTTRFDATPRWTSRQLHRLFRQEMLWRGVLFSGSQWVSLAHDDGALEEVSAAFDDAFRVLRFAVDSHAVTALLETLVPGEDLAPGEDLSPGEDL